MRLNISKKIALIAAIGAVASSAIILCISSILMGNLLDRTTHNEMSAMQSVIMEIQQQEESRLIYNMSVFATMPGFAEAVSARDAQKIGEVAATFLRQLELDAVTVADSNGLVIARGHSDKTGDDISGRPATIIALNGETASDILFDETAVIPYSFRCDAPVVKDGVVVGVISIALDIGNEDYVDNLHKITGMDFTLYKNDVSVISSGISENGKRANGLKLTEAQVTEKTLNDGEVSVVRSGSSDNSVITAYWPIKDIKGDIIGMWAVTKSLAGQNAETLKELTIVISCSLGVMLFTILAAILLGNRIARPVRDATNFAVQVAGGNLEADFEVHNRDEVGLLANALQTMVINLKERINEADAASKAKSSFLSIMSHEMRTPLNAIIGLTELNLDAEKLDCEQKERLEKIYASGTTLLGIVNDILDISKIESGKFEINPVNYDTPSLINDSVTLNIVRIADKPIEFKLFVDENLPGILRGDDLRVKQIFNNLLSNAFKYTNSGTVEWRLTFEKDGDSVWLVSGVKDTGIGIKPEDMKKLFSDYSQVNADANRQVEGTGLGLVIARRLAEMMDGSITVKSEYGVGTIFYIRLRQGFVSERAIGPETAKRLMESRYSASKREAAAKFIRADMSYARVLVVDDVPTNLDVAKGLLMRYGIRVDCVSSGMAAVEAIKTGSPRYDAVFMDHMMPGMDGVEATRIIREDIGTEYAGSVPIIALTANVIYGNEEMFLHKGFQAFISKPIDVMKLDSVLRQWVRDKSRETIAPAALPASGPERDNGGLSIQIPGLDAENGLSLYNYDADIYLPVLRSYALNTPAIIEQLRDVDGDNLSDYGIGVHGLKGSSRSIGARETGNKAARLEQLAKNGNLSGVLVENEEMLEDARALVAGIRSWFDIYDAVNKKPRMPAPDPELLQNLKFYCEQYSMNGVNEVLDTLESACYDEGNDLVEWLRIQADLSDFGAMAERITLMGG